LGIDERKGYILTCLVLDLVTTQVDARAELCSGLESTKPNLHTILTPDSSTPVVCKTVKSHTDSIDMDIAPYLLNLLTLLLSRQTPWKPFLFAHLVMEILSRYYCAQNTG
jgi:hypothetical protein